MKNAIEQNKKLAIFFAITSGICGILVLLAFLLYITILNQLYFVLFFSIFSVLGGIILIAAIVFWVRFLKLKKQQIEKV